MEPDRTPATTQQTPRQEGSSLYAPTIYGLIESVAPNKQLRVVRTKVAEYFYLLGCFLDTKRENQDEPDVPFLRETMRQRYLMSPNRTQEEEDVHFPDDEELSNINIDIADSNVDTDTKTDTEARKEKMRLGDSSSSLSQKRIPT